MITQGRRRRFPREQRGGIGRGCRDSNEGLAVRVVAWWGILILCLAVTGCSLFGRGRGWRSTPTSGPGSGPAAPAAPAVATPPAQGRIGMLAGRIVDPFDQKPPKAYIRVVDTTDPKGAPIDVEADGSGYFTIQGLEEKRQYRLIARARDGDRFLAGNTFATASHSNLVIRISEDFVVPGTPDVPNWPGGKMPGDGGSGDKKEQQGNAPAGAWNTPDGAKKDPPVQLGTPTPNGQGPPKNGGPSGPSVHTPRPEGIADRSDQRAHIETPRVIIKGPGAASGSGGGPEPNIPKVEIPKLNSAPRTAAVPSCTGTRHKVDNFALNDINGQPWEFKTSPKGQLVLLDFWGTWCHYCIAGMPDMIDLQARYGPWGLDVVGVAYEEGPLDEQVQKVKQVYDSKQLNYHILMGTGSRVYCPVREWFHVERYPTMILLDREGNILWRAEGKLDGFKKQQLEAAIRERLNIR